MTHTFSALALRVIPTLSSSAPTMHLQQGACGCHSSHQVAQASLDWSVHHAGKLEDSALVFDQADTSTFRSPGHCNGITLWKDQHGSGSRFALVVKIFLR